MTIATERPYRCKRKHGLTDNYRVNSNGSRTCRDCERELRQARERQRPELARERTRRWRERNPERSREVTRRSVAKWRESNPAAAAYQKDYRAAYYEANKDRFFQAAIARRRLLAETVNDLTINQWEVLKRLCGYRCGYCGERKPLERDHVIPVSKGGRHTLANIIPACRTCNRAKGARLNWTGA